MLHLQNIKIERNLGTKDMIEEMDNSVKEYIKSKK